MKQRSNERGKEQTSPLQWDEVFSAADDLTLRCSKKKMSDQVRVPHTSPSTSPAYFQSQ